MHCSPLFRPLLALLAIAALVNCGSGPSGTVAGPDNPPKTEPAGNAAAARFTLQLGKVGVLYKTSAIHLRKLVLTATSGTEVVRDTSLVEGNDAVTVKRLLKLKPMATWTLKAHTLDQRDSVVHRGESQPFAVKMADTAEVALQLASRFVMYQAVFRDLPNSISTTQGGSGRIGINLDRLVFKVDGVARADSLVPAWFSVGQTVTLNHDYVTPGAHSVTLEAYGEMDGYKGLMFAGSAVFDSEAGPEGSKPVTLAWAGPSTGGGDVTLILGHIGKVTVVGAFNPNL